MKEETLKAASLLSNSKRCAVLTGAGISVDSEIPAFRGYQGLWEKYDPMEFAHIHAFMRDPGKVWEMLRELMTLFFEAKPNSAHFALAKLEKMGIVGTIITQNIDGLHQRAGSENVIEYHGNAWKLACLHCERRYDTEEKVKREMPPLCECGSVLKPDVVFFGEPIPRDAAILATHSTREADLFMVVGSSGTVAPANELPFLALQRNVPVIIINPEKSDFVDHPGTLWVEEKAQDALTGMIEFIEKSSGKN